ncbi:hypothetical protein Vadar_009140 [Vaccinium darrowii]|uniref:Uncharacterized protein n=1 Tax=Vaccinium darrowii TaxID=229202 RepID=A0ACB7XGP0_9ERIC|nr:hypothetical protein Vadar_009140 [Vaccinium darrowii]
MHIAVLNLVYPGAEALDLEFRGTLLRSSEVITFPAPVYLLTFSKKQFLKASVNRPRISSFWTCRKFLPAIVLPSIQPGFRTSPSRAEMARVRDRMEDFKDAVHRSALSLGYDESKLAAVLASFIMHKPRQRSSFIKAALTTLESIGELEQFLVKHKKDYVDLHRTTEQERDSIEHEITVFVKACKEQIDILKSSINDEESNSKGWLGIKGDHSNADTIAHKHGVVLILSERLHSVTRQFDQLRSIRFQEAINQTIPRRRPKRVDISKSTDNSHSNKIELKEPNDSGLRDPDEIQTDPIRVQQQLLDDETRALQMELTSLLDAAQETETKMVEMSALNHLMSTHVLQQTQQIEFLYEQAVEATKNVELGNKELSQAIQRNSSSRTFLLLFLFVMTFSIIFLDWYS